MFSLQEAHVHIIRQWHLLWHHSAGSLAASGLVALPYTNRRLLFASAAWVGAVIQPHWLQAGHYVIIFWPQAPTSFLFFHSTLHYFCKAPGEPKKCMIICQLVEQRSKSRLCHHFLSFEDKRTWSSHNPLTFMDLDTIWSLSGISNGLLQQFNDATSIKLGDLPKTDLIKNNQNESNISMRFLLSWKLDLSSHGCSETV